MYNNDQESTAEEEIGSDELLAADDLRLPESANTLVRLHALRAWLNRRCAETELEIGTAALDLQVAMLEAEGETRPRRRSAQEDFPTRRAQRYLASAQQRLSAYDEASTLLEDCVAHTTTGERLLVEYYLSLEELVQASESLPDSPWLAVMAEVLHRVEQVGTAGEGEE
jgi:hypothetical protein